VGGVLVLATVYWIFWARKFFKGPKRPENQEVQSTEEKKIIDGEEKAET